MFKITKEYSDIKAITLCLSLPKDMTPFMSLVQFIRRHRTRNDQGMAIHVYSFIDT